LADPIAITADVLVVGAAIVFASKCLIFSRTLKQGYLARNFLIVSIASILFIFAEIAHLLGDAGLLQGGELVHDVIEAVFVMVLAVGIVRFYPSWMPK
jgi:hypothetical protein